MNERKLILLGLDGATWDVLDPLIGEGIMPNLRKIVENGTSTKMSSTFPPITAPAWLSMATGKNPGKTGVTNFSNVKKNIRETELVTSSDFRKNGAYWNHLKDHGYKIYLMGYPMVYPYYDINGVMIGGWGTPDDAKLAHPPEIENRIEEISGGYVNYVPWRSKKYKNNKEQLIQDLKSMHDKQVKVLRELMKDDWDFFCYVSSVSDFLQHAFWGTWEKNDSPYHEAFIDIWTKIDKMIGDVAQHDESNLFIVSDHGFGPLKNRFLPSKWLLKKDYLRKKKFYFLKKQIISFLSLFHRKMKSKSFYDKIGLDESQVLNLARNKTFKESMNVSLPYPTEVDLEKSIAVSRSSGIHGVIEVLEENKERKQKLRKQIKEGLKEFSREKDFELTIYENEEIYDGARVDETPDLLFFVDDYACFVNSSRLEGKVYSRDYDFEIKSGTHRKEGIFCAYGPDIKSSGKIEEIEIYDIAPTILHYFGTPVPNDIDGRVLKEIFTEKSEAYEREIEFSDDPEKEKLKNVIGNLKI